MVKGNGIQPHLPLAAKAGTSQQGSRWAEEVICSGPEDAIPCSSTGVPGSERTLAHGRFHRFRSVQGGRDAAIISPVPCDGTGVDSQ